MFQAGGASTEHRISRDHGPAKVSGESPTSACRHARAEEINRLHQEAVRLSAQSRDSLHAALVAAWTAGQLLGIEKNHVRRTMGPGAWGLWLQQYFRGSPRTAQRYLLLAKTVSDASLFSGMSLRQVYFRLGIATEPKLPGGAVVLPPLPRHAVFAGRLLGLLKSDPHLLPLGLRTTFRQDLRPLYERLRVLFEPGTR
jgi:hypothetical protein